MMIAATRCNDCGSYVSRDIQFDENGRPYWICPCCGVFKEDHRWYKYVSRKEAIEIIEHRGCRGLFVEEDGGTYIGIDNSTGDAWVEEFPDLTECLMWLADAKEEMQ